MIPDPIFSRAQGRVGSVVADKWRLDALLGVGGMASVYAATHRNGSRAAVKMLHPEMSANEAARERFLWEGYVANAVRHDGVVKVLDDDADQDGSLYLVTELLDGETFEERRLRLGGRIAEDECLLLTDQVLEVLGVAHAAGIVHRDVKPDNLFLTRAGQVKLLDFGIAKLRQSSASKHVTEQGLTLGTPAYMSPEQACGLSDEVDERSDIWACGATMYCLLSGQTVHNGRTANEQLVEAMTEAAPPLSASAPDVPFSIAQVVDRALEFSKSERWPTAASMRYAIHRVYESLYGLSVATAPKLALGAGVPDRAPSQRPGARVMHDQWPMPAPQSDVSSYRPLARSLVPSPKHASVGVRIAVGLGVAVIGVGSMIAFGHLRTRGPRESVAVASVMSASKPSAAEVAEVAASAPPEVSVTDLPLARMPAFVGGRVRTTAPEAQSPSAVVPSPRVRSAAPDCQPPYVVDPTTEKKHWKMDCL
jgi:serine/threonine-protein kinase